MPFMANSVAVCLISLALPAHEAVDPRPQRGGT
jgi:hypothetical protein